MARKSIDAVALLKADHRKVEDLFDKFEKAREKRGEGLFAQARKAGLDLDTLGERLMARKQELMEQIESQGLPTMQTRSFTGHRLEQGRPVHSGIHAAGD